MAGWEDVREFTLGNISRPATRIEFGPNAIRAVQGSDDERVLDPYAYVGANRSLYLDADLTQLLCQVVVSGEHSWSVQDDSAAIIGTITRLPSHRRLLRPNWRIDQPGQPVITGRTEWLSGSPGRLAAKAVTRLIAGVVDGLTGIGDEGGDASKDRILEWRTSDELVMISNSSIRITVDWLDRRLAFAYTLLAK